MTNRGGNGDHATGLRLVKKFLTFVCHLHPKCWVLGDVPLALPLLEEGLTADATYLVRPGFVLIPQRHVPDAATFGVPMHRRPLLAGDFPVPDPPHGFGRSPLVPLSSVLPALPNPSMGVDGRGNHVGSPNYSPLHFPIAA
jgi:hypothetical protein